MAARVPSAAVPELNLDGIVGPTHNYAGLSHGNVASTGNQGSVSRPREAALQGLAKMAAVAELGVAQGFLPPQERPHMPTLRALGFEGSDAAVLEKAAREAPHLLARACSASSMWTANAATVSPSADTADGRVHLTVANLRAMPHRSIEPPQTARTLRAVFADEATFAVHDALPSDGPFGDEGAANHTRLTPEPGNGGEVRGVHLFVYGASEDEHCPRPQRFPARQTREASERIVQVHGLPADRVVLAQQNPSVIDLGVFHNDVIGVGNGCFLLLHEQALLGQRAVLAELRERLGPGFVPWEVPSDVLSVEDAVATYFFNSQVLTLPDGAMAMVLPRESEKHDGVRHTLDAMVGDAGCPVKRAVFLDVRESMRNGGGPACLRLRVALTQPEMSAMTQGCLFTPERAAALEKVIRTHYRETLAPADLADPKLLEESRAALDAMSRALGLGSIYEFQ